MAGRRCLYNGGDGSNMTSVLLPNKRPADSFFLSAFSPSVPGSKSMVSFEDIKGRNNCGGFFFQSYDQDEIGDEEYDEYFQQPEKKRRLKADQIQFLEKSFEKDNKLEPDRKIQLAKDLGLQPRQVAVWFQNRRARWKNKTLERDYEVLQNSYNSLKADYDNLVAEKEKLKAEVLDLTDKLILNQKQNGDRMLSEKQETSEALQQEHVVIEFSEGEVVSNSVMACKQEDFNWVKTDTIYSDSANYSDGVHSNLMEPVYRSYILEPDQSDISQDEEDDLSKSLFVPLAYVFPKIGDFNYPDPPANSCYFGLPVEEDQTFGFWGY